MAGLFPQTGDGKRGKIRAVEPPWERGRLARMPSPIASALLAGMRAGRPRSQDAALLLLALDRLGAQPYSASPDELRAIDEALAQAARGEFASDQDVEAAFARFRR